MRIANENDKEQLPISRAEQLVRHIEITNAEVQRDWPHWKQVLLRPRRARNGFKT